MTARGTMFSVVIPTFNRGAKIGHAIDSVLEQTLQKFEIIVVDDGSDGTEQLLRDKYGDRVRYFRGTGKGVAAARNLAIGHATGEWVAFLDSDDWWYPTKLEKVAAAAKAHPEIGLFYSKMDLVDEVGRYIRTPPIRTRRDVYPAVAEGNFIFNSTAVIRKECLDVAGAFDTRVSGCEDWELMIRITRSFPALLIDESLVAYELLSTGSLTRHHEKWVAAQDEVAAKAIADDPTLSADWIRRIRAGAAYADGLVYLGAGQERHALDAFKTAWRLNRRRWRAAVYVVLLSWKPWRLLLPRRAKVLLRLS
ncbi:MAG TPA: glycosyltransferase [Thermoanaerobaculia bacterium]